MPAFFKIQGQEIENPVNLGALSIQINNDTNDPDARFIVTVPEVIFGKDASKQINQYIEEGLNGGPGIFEGLPGSLVLREGGLELNLVDGYIDLRDPSALFECDQVTAPLVQRGGNDWFEKAARQTTFSYLAEGLEIGDPGKRSRDGRYS